MSAENVLSAINSFQKEDLKKTSVDEKQVLPSSEGTFKLQKTIFSPFLTLSQKYNQIENFKKS